MYTTFCPRCKKILTFEEFESLDQCPHCGYDFDRSSYGFVIVVSLLLALLPWTFILKFPEEPRIKVFFLSLAFLSFAFWDILVSKILRFWNVPRIWRSRISPWVAMCLALLLGRFLFQLNV